MKHCVKSLKYKQQYSWKNQQPLIMCPERADCYVSIECVVWWHNWRMKCINLHLMLLSANIHHHEYIHTCIHTQTQHTHTYTHTPNFSGLLRIIYKKLLNFIYLHHVTVIRLCHGNKNLQNCLSSFFPTTKFKPLKLSILIVLWWPSLGFFSCWIIL